MRNEELKRGIWDAGYGMRERRTANSEQRTAKSLFLFLLLLISLCSFSQSPDLLIGAHVDQQFLTDPGMDQHYYTPGIALDIEVSKNLFAGILSLGMKGADPQNRQAYPDQFTKYFLNLDLTLGVFLIKHPAFKWRFNLGASNMLNINRYHSDSDYNIPDYSLQACPELSFRYKYYIATVYYSVPLVGFMARGAGLRIGVGF